MASKLAIRLLHCVQGQFELRRPLTQFMIFHRQPGQLFQRPAVLAQVVVHDLK